MIDRERISARQHGHDNLNTTHLPLSPSPEGGGGGGTQAVPLVTPSPPLGAERAGVRWGRLLVSAIMGTGMRQP